MAASRFQRALLAGSALWPVLTLHAAVAQTVAPNARPTGGQVVAGAATISRGATTTTINQTTNRAAIDWNTFNVGANQSVQFQQPNQQSWTLNRVNTPDPSVIAGRVTANGHIAIVNQSGVLFAEGAQVNVAGLIASAANITNENFMAGNLAFTGPANAGARVENRGTITVADQGLAVLAGPRAANSGTINARMGRVALQGAEAYTLDLAGDGMLSIDVTQQVRSAPGGTTALVTNSGTINAQGGTVQLTASAASGLVETLVNNTGSVVVGSGQAVLRAQGGGVNAGGTINATNAAGQGGSINISATGDVTVPTGAVLDASGTTGGGRVAVGGTTTRRATVAAGSTVRADATQRGNGGNVVVNSAESTQVLSRLSARGGAQGGNGGLVETSSGAALLVALLPDVSAPLGLAGTWLLDPVNITIRNSNASGAAETNGTLAGGVFTTDGVAGDPTTVIIDPTLINNYAGNVVLTATNTVTVASAIDKTSGNNSANPGTLTLAAGAGGIIVNATVAVDSGIIFTSGGVITLNASLATLAANSISLSSTGGAISQTAGTITTGTLVASTSSGGIALTRSNPVDSVSLTAAGQTVGFTSNRALTVTALDAAATTLGGSSLTLDGTISATTLNLNSNGAISQNSGTVTATSLLAQGAGGSGNATSIALNQAGNGITTLTKAAATGAVNVRSDLATFSVTDAAGSAITLTNNFAGGALSLTGAVDAGGGLLTLNANGAISQTGGIITAGTLLAQGGAGSGNAASVDLTQAGNAFTALTNATATGAIAVRSDAATFTVNGATGVGVTLTNNALTGALTLGGSVDAGSASGTLTLNANGAISQNNGTTITASSLLAQGGAGSGDAASITLNRSGNAITTLTTANASGAITVRSDVATFTVADAAGQGITLTNRNGPGDLTLSGTINASHGGAGALTLNANGAVSQSGGTITADTLLVRGEAGSGDAGSVSLNRAGNAITTLTSAAASGAVDVRSDVLLFTVVAASGSAVTLTNNAVAADLTLTGAVGAGGGTVTLNATGAIGQSSGTLTAGHLVAQGGAGSGNAGSIALTQANAITTLDTAAATGTISVRSDVATFTVTDAAGAGITLTNNRSVPGNGALTLAGTVDAGASTLTLNATGAISQSGGHINAASLVVRGGAGSGNAASIALNRTTNTITELTSAAATGAVSVYSDVATFTAVAVSGVGITLTGTDALALTGTINAGTSNGNTLTLNADGIINQSAGTVTANSVVARGTAGSGNATSLSLNQAGNAITTLTSAATSGAITVRSDVAGNFSAADVAGLGITLTNNNGTGALRLTGTVNASAGGAGTLTLNANAAISQSGGSATANSLVARGGAGSGNAASIALNQTGNAITTLTSAAASGAVSVYSDVATFTAAAVSGVGITLTGTDALTLTGTINAGTSGGNTLTLNADGIITQSSGTVTANSLVVRGTAGSGNAGSIDVALAGNAITTLTSAAATGAVTVRSDVATFTVAAAAGAGISLVNGNVAGNLTLSGNVNAGGLGTLTLNAPGTVSQSGGGITAGTVTLSSTGTTTLDSSSNFISTAQGSSTGTITLVNNAGFLTLGALGTSAGSVVVNTIANLSTTGAVEATTGITLNAAGTLALGADVHTTGGNISLSATVSGGFSGISQTAGQVVADANASITLRANAITLLAADAVKTGPAGLTGEVLLTSATTGRGITLGGNTAGTLAIATTSLSGIATGQLTVGEATSGAMHIAGAVTSPAATLILNSGTSITLDQGKSLSGAAVRLVTAGSITLNGTLGATTDLGLRADGAVTQDAVNGSITTPILRVGGRLAGITQASSISLTSTTNSIDALTTLSASGALAVTSGAATVTVTNVIGNGVDLYANGGDLAVSGTANAGAGLLMLRASGAITSGGTLTGGTVQAQASGAVTLAPGAAGSLPILGESWSGGGGATPTADFSFITPGAVQVSGDITGRNVLLSAAGNLTLDATRQVSGGAVTLLGGTGGGKLQLNGGVVATTSLRLEGGNLVGAHVAGDSILQGAAGTITTPYLVAVANDSITLGGSNSIAWAGGAALGGSLTLNTTVALAETVLTTPTGLDPLFDTYNASLVSAGAMSLTSTHASGITIDAGFSLGSTAGTLALTADAMSFAGTAAAATSITLRPFSNNTGIQVGASVANTLVLAAADLALLQTPLLSLQATGTGGVNIATGLDLRTPGFVTTLDLQGSAISQVSATVLNVANVTGSAATGAFGLSSTANTVDSVGAITAGTDIVLATTSTAVGSVFGINGVLTAGSNRLVKITADDLDITAAIRAPGGTVALQPLDGARGVTLGGAAAGTLQLSNTELAFIQGSGITPAARLRIAAGGAIAVAGNVDLRADGTFDADRVQTLDLISAAGITQTAATRLNVANLAAQGTGVALDSTANTVDALVLGTTLSGTTLAAGSYAVQASTGDVVLKTTRNLAVNGAVDAAGLVAITGRSITNNVLISAATSNTLTASTTSVTNSGTGSITGATVTLDAPSTIDNDLGGSITATGNLFFGLGVGATLTNNGSLTAGTGAGGGSVALDGGFVNNAGSIAAGSATKAGDITITTSAFGITNHLGASMVAAGLLTFNAASGQAITNDGTLTAGIGAAGGNANLTGGYFTNSGAIAAGSATLPGDITISSDTTGIWNQTGGTITASGALTLHAAGLTIVNDGTLTAAIGGLGGALSANARSITNTGSMQSGGALLPGTITLTVSDGGAGTLSNDTLGVINAGNGITLNTAGGAAGTATLGGSIQAGQNAAADISLNMAAGSFSLSGSLGARDISLTAGQGRTTTTAAITADRDLTLSLDSIDTSLLGSHTMGRDFTATITGAGNSLVLGGSWGASGNVNLTGPGGITINGSVGTSGASPAGVVDVQSTGGALAIGASGHLYGRRLQGSLGADTTLTEVASGPGAIGVTFAELGTLGVAGNFSYTVTDAAALPYSINGIVSVGSTNTLTLVANDLSITALGGLRAPGGSVVLRPHTAGTAITVGGTVANTLSLDTAELGRIGATATPVANLTIGNANAGAITIAGDAVFRSGVSPLVSKLTLLSGGSITQAASTALNVPTIAATATGDILLEPFAATNLIDATSGLSAGGDLVLRSSASLLTLAGTTQAGDSKTLRLIANDMAITGTVTVPNGTLEMLPTDARGITLGGSGPGTLAIDGTELAFIGPIGTLRLGGIGGNPASAGDITINGPVTVTGLPVLDLMTTGSVLGSGGAVTMGTVHASAVNDVLLDNAGNRFAAGAVSAGTGRTIRLTDPPDLVLTGPISAPGGLVVLTSADAIIQNAGAVITTGMLQINAGGLVTLLEANSFTTLGASSFAGGTVRGLTYSVTGPLVVTGNLTLQADGALSLPGNLTVGGTLQLIAGTALNLAGNTNATGALNIDAGQSVVLSGNAGAGGALQLNAGTSLTLSGSVAANSPLELHAGTTMNLIGGVSSTDSLLLVAGGQLNLSGNANAGTTLSLSAGSSLILTGVGSATGALNYVSGTEMSLGGVSTGASFTGLAGTSAALTGTINVAGRASLQANGSLTVGGTLVAEVASLIGSSVRVSGLNASIGTALLFTGPGGITAGSLSTINGRTSGQYPAVVFDTRLGPHTDPLTLVQPDFPSRLPEDQATQVTRGSFFPGSFGPASSASAGTLELNLNANNSAVFMLVDGGRVSGNVSAGRLGLQGAGGGAGLLGSLGGIPGSGAAHLATITHPIDGMALSNYRLNDCVFGSVNCIAPPTVQLVPSIPARTPDLTLGNSRIDTSEVTIPNVSDTDYQ